MVDKLIDAHNQIFNLLCSEDGRLCVATFVSSFMNNTKVYYRVNRAEGACLTAADTAKGTITLGRSISIF